MMLKGIVSAVNHDKLSIILPEKDWIVTKPIPIYGGSKKAKDYMPNDIVFVMVFNDDLNDCVVVGDSYEITPEGEVEVEALTNSEIEAILNSYVE